MRSSAGKRELDLVVIDGVATDRLDTCDVPVFLWAVEREIDCISLVGYMGKNPDIMFSTDADSCAVEPWKRWNRRSRTSSERRDSTAASYSARAARSIRRTSSRTSWR